VRVLAPAKCNRGTMAKLGTTLAGVLRLWIPKPFPFLIFCHLPPPGEDRSVPRDRARQCRCRVLHGQG
jgi:hypothetical protein